MTPTIPIPGISEQMARFSEALKEAGMATHMRAVIDACRSAELVGVADKYRFHAALSANFVTDLKYAPVFDHVFERFWANRKFTEEPPEHPESGKIELTVVPPRNGADETSFKKRPPSKGGAGDQEILLKKDLREMAPEEEPGLEKILRSALMKMNTRPGRRMKPSKTGAAIDFGRTLRREGRTGGELLKLLRREKKLTKRKLAFLGDVSGSMDVYGRFFFQMAYQLAGMERATEVYAFSTKLFNLTAHVKDRTSGRSLGRALLDTKGWSGGTKIGACVKEFHDSLARRSHLSGTTVIILSDGWDRGDPDLLKRELARLRSAVRTIHWLNPLKGDPGYRPLSRGMATALPYLDGFHAAHNLESLIKFAKSLSEGR